MPRLNEPNDSNVPTARFARGSSSIYRMERGLRSHSVLCAPWRSAYQERVADMKTRQLLTVAVLSLILGLPTFADAQQSAQEAPPAPERTGGFEQNILALIRKVGVHGNMSVRHPTDNDVTRGVSFGPSIGLSPGRTNGWKYPVALSMFSEDLHSPSGAQFGSVRTWALMAGIGYGWHFGQLSVGPQVEIGYAFNHSTLEGDAPQAFASPGSIALDVSNSWMLRPEFKAEYLLTPKFSIRSSLDYVRLRPDVTVMTPAGAVPNTWNLSNVHANVGVAFYPFRQ
jgi:hypothetical protein